MVARSTVAMQQRIARFVSQQEMNVFNGEIINKETGEVRRPHFPQPWDFFRQEVMIRVFGKADRDSDVPVAETQEALISLLQEKLSSRPQAVHEYVTRCSYHAHPPGK